MLKHSSLCLGSGAGGGMYTPLKQIPGFSRLSRCHCGFPTRRRLVSTTQTIGKPSLRLDPLIPRMGVLPGQFQCPPIPTVLTQSLVFPPHSIMCGSFLQPWLCRSPSTGFQSVFSENCSTSRRVFDVFMGSECHVLLLCHLDLLSPGP